jgi:hypothetical protein
MMLRHIVEKFPGRGDPKLRNGVLLVPTGDQVAGYGRRRRVVGEITGILNGNTFERVTPGFY